MDLLPNEHVKLQIRPHPIRQLREYPLWIWILFLSICFTLDPELVRSWIKYNMGVESYSLWFYDLLFSIHKLLPFALMIYIPALILAIFRLRWKPLVSFSLSLVAVGIAGQQFTPISSLVYQLGIWMAVLMLSFKEFQRVSTQYFLTNRRLVLKHQGTGETIRSLFLSNIQDVILKTSFLGNLLDYGTVVPLTASGIGTGSSTSSAGIHSSAGSKLGVGLSATQSAAVINAEASPEYALVCIPKAREAYRLILQASDLK